MKKTLSIILVCVMLLALLVSCGEETGNTSKEASSSDVSASDVSKEDDTSEESAAEESSEPTVPVIDLEGRVIRVLSRNWANTSITYNGEIIQREDFDIETADALDVAKYEARLRIEQLYHCTIEGTFSTNFETTIYNQVYAGLDDPYDICFDGHSQAAANTQKGVYVDINSIDTIDLSNPWWDQNSVNDLSIGGKIYFVSGDINTFDNDGTFIMFFNKELMEKCYPGTSIYDYVYNNEWTLDKFYELVRGVTANTNNDDVLDEFDTWGFGTENYNCFLQVFAGGQTITTKNSDDLPEFSYRTESFYKVLSDVYDLYLDDANVMVAQHYSSKYPEHVHDNTVIKAFREGRELFYMGGMFNFTNFRDIDFHIGYMPVPKYTAEQDRYYHFLSTGNSSCMAIPASADDYDDLGILIEAIACESKKSVSPVYYNKCVKGKDADTEDDENMLDIIFNSRCFDLGAIYGWGGVSSAITKIDKDYVSRFESIADAADIAMADSIEYILNLDY